MLDEAVPGSPHLPHLALDVEDDGGQRMQREGAPEEAVASEIPEFTEDGGAVGVTGGYVVAVGKGSDIVAWQADTRLIGFLILPGTLRSL